MTAERVERQALKRRGILAAAGAVVAQIVATQTAPVRATNGDTLTAGNAFTETAPFYLTNTYGTVSAPFTSAPGTTAVFRATDGADAVRGMCWGHDGIGVFGVSNLQGIGVVGTSDTGSTFLPSNVGVYGQGASLNAASIGVFGQVFGNAGIGVSGDAATGVRGTGVSLGVSGIIPSGFSPANSIATQGLNQGTGANGTGVYGQSATGYGMLGYTTGGSASVGGISTNINIPAFAGGNAVANGLAAHFTGTVYVDCATLGGNFVVNPMTAKNGLLRHPDGSHRLMYTMEAPESWAEDFGRAQLVGGKAEVKLDPDFAALIRTDDYHVFLTPHADTNGLHVTTHGPVSFTVQEHKGGTASLRFSWRVVARPKSDKQVERLAKFGVPSVPLPDVSTLPKPAVPPRKP